MPQRSVLDLVVTETHALVRERHPLSRCRSTDDLYEMPGRRCRSVWFTHAAAAVGLLMGSL